MFMVPGFEHEKKQFLRKLDKSKKGSIDVGVRRLVNLINKKKEFYTTSSCSGRTILIKVPTKGKKWDSKWLFTIHGKTTLPAIKKSLTNLPKDPVWFKKEGMILHVCCRTIESASILADLAIKAGFRRSGILAKKKIIVEINDTEKIEVPVCVDGKKVVDDDYLKLLVKLANDKHEKTKKKIAKFEKLIKKL